MKLNSLTKIITVAIVVVFLLTTLPPMINAQLTQQLSYTTQSSPLNDRCHYTLTIYTEGNGTVEKNPDYSQYSPGTEVELTATPDVGWSFSHWSGDLSGSTNPATIVMNEDKQVTAHFTQDEYSLIVNIQGNGSVILSPDQTSYTYGTIVILTANPEPGWYFSHWSGDLSGTENPTDIIMTSDKNVTAHFVKEFYTLIINIEGNGTVEKNPDQDTYPYGTEIELNATPDIGWKFSYWTGNLSGTNSSETIVMDDDKTITAHFLKQNYTLTITTDGQGTVTKEPSQPNYAYGQVVTLEAFPEEGWKFSHWSGDLNGSINPATITITENKTVTAHFVQFTYVLDITIDGSGTVTKNPDLSEYPYGTEVELTAVADNGWDFSHWSGDVSGELNPETIIIDDNKSVTAHFTEISDDLPPTIEITKPTNAIYLFDNQVIPFLMPLIVRGITIEVEAVDNESGIEKVEFYIDDVLEETDTEAPYSWKWSDDSIRKHSIKVVAYDFAGNTADATLDVWKWKFHPAFFIVTFALAAIILILNEIKR